MSARDWLSIIFWSGLIALLVAGAVNSILAHQRIRNSVCVPIEALSPATSPRRRGAEA